ncbi:MAG: hypothetical protein KDB53_19760 [Planctomycetes bacterium]|nr:hypothetical protein [Planctomycetota bacterium]
MRAFLASGVALAILVLAALTVNAVPSSGHLSTREAPQDEGFAANAFPPTLPDTEWHQNAWIRNDCLRCHETGVGDAPQIVHRDLPDILRVAKCRTCHILIPGSKPRPKPETPKPTENDAFESWAFPPMIPASGSHPDAWRKDDCYLCHETGIGGAPVVVHKGLPPIALKSKCRSCHVQVRTVEATKGH